MKAEAVAALELIPGMSIISVAILKAADIIKTDFKSRALRISQAMRRSSDLAIHKFFSLHDSDCASWVAVISVRESEQLFIQYSLVPTLGMLF